jgi:hypothetical protein
MGDERPAPEGHASALTEAMTSGGPAGVIAYIESLHEPERLAVYAFAQRLFSQRGDASAPFDDYTQIVRSGIGEALRRSAAADDPTASMQLKDTANVFSFNLLADLAECWPDDRAPRERRHFEEGLRAAEDCVRWREELGKPNDRKAMGWWGKGMHLLSLERNHESVEAFQTACALVFPNDRFDVSAERSFDQILYLGYYALGRIADGDVSGEGDLVAAQEAFRAQLDDAEKHEDAAFGIEQLRVVEERIRSREGV